MVNYQNGKIYKITSNQTEQVYIGSTCNPLSKRMAKHRETYKMHLAGKYNNVSSFEILAHGDAIIVLVENCPCDNKEQLFRRERFHIENTANCVNNRIPGRTNAERYQENKEVVLGKCKAYYETNKANIAEKRNQKHECPCGRKYTASNIGRHCQSKKHQTYIAQVKKDNDELLNAFVEELGL